MPSREPSAIPTTISGTVITLDRGALPDNSIVIVTLWNATTGDSTPVARIRFRAKGQQIPIPYALTYDGSEIDPGQEYVLAGEIDSAGRGIYRTNSSIPVITQGNPADDVEIVLEPIR